MKKINPKVFRLLLIIGLVVNVQKSNAQQLLEYKNGQKKVIKVIKEQGSALYFQNWPDTINGSIKAVLLSDIAALTLLKYSDVDSVYAQLLIEAEQRQQKNVEENLARKKIWRENIGLVVMEVDMNTAIAKNRVDFGGGFAIGVKRKNGLTIMAKTGVDITNQGRGFIKTTQIPIALQVNYDMNSKMIARGVPFLQVTGGYNYVVSGTFDKTRDRTEQYIDYTNDQLEGNMFISLGGGLMYKNRIRCGIFYKPQGGNVKYPEVGYIHFLMVKLSMIL